MKKSFLVTLALFPLFAQASAVDQLNLHPEAGLTSCFKRVYTSEHLAKNPNQLLTEVYFRVKGHEIEYNNQKEKMGIAYVIGRHQSKLWGNEASCDFNADGSIYCYVECDGGSFTVKPKKDSILFQVTQNYYYPLFQHKPVSEATQPESISLEGEDNGTYKLIPADDNECLNAIREFEQQPVSATECGVG